MDYQKQSTEPRTTKKVGHISSARNPNRFKDETLDHRQHNIFKHGFSHNGSFSFKYKKKLDDMNFGIKNSQQFQSRYQRTNNKTEIKFDVSSKELRSFGLNGDLELQKKPRLGLHFHYRPDNLPISFSSSISGEAENLKDFKVASTYTQPSYKLKVIVSSRPVYLSSFQKFQANKGFIKKETTASSWSYQLCAIGAYKVDGVYDKGIDINHEEIFKNGGGVEGITLLKFGRSNARNFGALVEHKLNVAKANYIPRFYNLLWFYNTPEALFTLKFKNIWKPQESFAATVVSRFTKNIEVGVMFDYDAGKNVKNLHYGVLHQNKDKEFRIKVKDNLDAAIAYSFRVTKRINMGFSYKFALGYTRNSVSNTEYMFPLGIKLEVKD